MTSILMKLQLCSETDVGQDPMSEVAIGCLVYRQINSELATVTGSTTTKIEHITNA